jgi:hypothetical protein
MSFVFKKKAGKHFEYEVYENRDVRRKFVAWGMEDTGNITYGRVSVVVKQSVTEVNHTHNN